MKPVAERGVQSGTGKMHFVGDDGRLACHRQLVNGRPVLIYGIWDWCGVCHDAYKLAWRLEHSA